jgi:hypothetical protein
MGEYVDSAFDLDLDPIKYVDSDSESDLDLDPIMYVPSTCALKHCVPLVLALYR